MITEKEMLNKIQWDINMQGFDYKVGVYDRVTKEIVEHPLLEMIFEDGNKFSFTVLDEKGYSINIPFHRIRTFKQDKKLIWKRGGE